MEIRTWPRSKLTKNYLNSIKLSPRRSTRETQKSMRDLNLEELIPTGTTKIATITESRSLESKASSPEDAVGIAEATRMVKIKMVSSRLGREDVAATPEAIGVIADVVIIVATEVEAAGAIKTTDSLKPITLMMRMKTTSSPLMSTSSSPK